MAAAQSKGESKTKGDSKSDAKSETKPESLSERKARERADRTALIQKASKGDKKAIEILAGPPYHMKVYNPEEREQFIKENDL